MFVGIGGGGALAERSRLAVGDAGPSVWLLRKDDISSSDSALRIGDCGARDGGGGPGRATNNQ